MTEKTKTRPVDNLHCFKGMGRVYWERRARGFEPIIQKGKYGHHVRLKTEKEGLDPGKVPNADSYAIQNGGVYSPQQTNMHPGTYYRFISSIGGNPTGHWWLEPEHYFAIRSLAREHDVSLSVAAGRCLVIPKEWGNCGILVQSHLNTRLHAFVGKGKPATGSVSPDNAKRDKQTQPALMAPAHIEIKQWFVPGEATLLRKVFSIEKTVNVLKKGNEI